jgi:predicted amidophosphoribosyltransferase
MVLCSHCGKEVTVAETNFCPNCGKSLTEQVASPLPPAGYNPYKNPTTAALIAIIFSPGKYIERVKKTTAGIQLENSLSKKD